MAVTEAFSLSLHPSSPSSLLPPPPPLEDDRPPPPLTLPSSRLATEEFDTAPPPPLLSWPPRWQADPRESEAPRLTSPMDGLPTWLPPCTETPSLPLAVG